MTGELAPSVIAADFGRLGEQLAAVEPHAARWHVDVMDGHYVPNLTIGPMFCRAIRERSTLPQDVHLMITNPAETWSWYADAGASRIAFHPETTTDPGSLLRTLTEAGIGPGLAVNPDVPASEVEPYLSEVDHLVLMSVYPGFSGQEFIPDVLPKLRHLRGRIDRDGLDVQLIVDGGVNPATAPDCVEAGVDVLVSASAVFGAADPAEAARGLLETFRLRSPTARGD